jgi:chromate transporter
MNGLTLTLHASDWWALFGQFMSLSLLAVGGAITTAPDMHRYLVDEQHWLTDAQFSTSIALAQASPGPNVLFVALMGWNVGLNAGGGPGAGPQAWGLALLGVFITMTGILIPSTTLTYFVAQWGQRNRQLRAVRAFKAGMAPIVIALLIATGWLLTGAQSQGLRDWPLAALTAVCALIVWKTRTHLLVLLAVGALLGALGWV